MDPNINHILFRYINQTDDNIDDIFNELSTLQSSEQEIASFVWSFMDLSKTMNVFAENANTRLQNLINYMSKKSEKYKELFFLILDRADTNQFTDINEMRKSYAIISKNRYSIEKYQFFYLNPEGFARLILFFFSKLSDPNDLIDIIGEHNIDPDVVLNMLFDLVSRDRTYHFISFFSQFSLQQTLPFVINGIYTQGDNFYYSILSHLLQNNKILYNNLWKVVGDPENTLSEAYSNYIRAIETHCKDLVVVRTILPGSTKEESYPSIFFEHEKECKKCKDTLCNSFFFRLLSNSQPFDFNLLRQIAKFDPCLFPTIAEALSNVLYTEFSKNPTLFLQTKRMLEYLCVLGCHCTQNKLIVGICLYPDLIPPYVLSNFVLQSISTNECAWQLSVPVYNCMMNYSMYTRRQIYKNFSANQGILGIQKVRMANVTRKIKSILFKKLSTKNIDQFTMKVSQLFLISPSISTDKLIEYIFTISNIASIPFLIIADLSPLSLDYLLLEIMERIETPGSFSDWPIEVATFLGKTFSEHFHSMDLNGYISFILKGLKKFKFQYLCLLKSLISEMACVCYRGNLSKSDIELRIGDNLLIYTSKSELEDQDEFTFSTRFYQLQKLFLKDDTALKFLTYIEHMLQKNDVNDPDDLDKMRFTFITICDFLSRVKITDLTPSELIKELHFSLPSATRISRCSFTELQSLSPEEVPSELFGRFWSYDSRDFHLPISKFNEIDNQFRIRIEQSDDSDFVTSLKLVKEQVSITMRKQKERIEKIRLEIAQKKWFTSMRSFSIYSGFVNHCIVPRMLYSQEDARYCALFIFSLSHFTDFQFNVFNRFFTQKLHFFILAASYEESRCIGLFVMKLLKYCRDREEEAGLHSFLISKMEIVMKHAKEGESEFLAVKAITVLDLTSKDFPKFNDDETKLDGLLDELEESMGQSVQTQIKRYRSNRATKKAKKDAKMNAMFAKQAEKDNENDEEAHEQNSSNGDSASGNESEPDSSALRKSQSNAHPQFKNLSRSFSSQYSSKPMSLSASPSRPDFASSNPASSGGPITSQRIKRSQSKQRSFINDYDDYDDDDDDANEPGAKDFAPGFMPRRSKSTSGGMTSLDENTSLHSNSSLDAYMFAQNASALANYYSMSQVAQWNQLMQMQMMRASAQAATTDQAQIQQQLQLLQQQMQAQTRDRTEPQNDEEQLQQQQQKQTPVRSRSQQPSDETQAQQQQQQLQQQQINSAHYAYSLNPYLAYYYQYK